MCSCSWRLGISFSVWIRRPLRWSVGACQDYSLAVIQLLWGWTEDFKITLNICYSVFTALWASLYCSSVSSRLARRTRLFYQCLYYEKDMFVKSGFVCMFEQSYSVCVLQEQFRSLDITGLFLQGLYRENKVNMKAFLCSNTLFLHNWCIFHCFSNIQTEGWEEFWYWEENWIQWTIFAKTRVDSVLDLGFVLYFQQIW